MTVYNVRVPVVALVEAKDMGDAIDQLAASLTRHGFEPFVFPDSGLQCFESEPLDFDPDPLP